MSNIIPEGYKRCTGCKDVKPVEEFYVSKRNKAGRVAQCIVCTKIRGQEWYKKNKEKHNARSREWQKNNKDSRDEYIREYNRVNHDKVLNRRREYKKENKEAITKTNREYQARTREERRQYEKAYEAEHKEERKAYLKVWRKNKTENDVQFKIKQRLRSRLTETLKASGTRKSLRTIDLLGCTLLEFRAHMESLFYGGMSWSNMGLGQGKWQIDHKIAIGLFDLSDLDQQKACFHWSNLQPLSHEEHLIKSKQDNKLIRERKLRDQTAA